MPPKSMRRPDRVTLDNVASWLETGLDRAATLHPNPGAPALQRMNRTEYANAIRDLLDLQVDVSKLLPSDSTVSGFDNIADVLGTSPSLIQSYVSAAMKISRLAVGDLVRTSRSCGIQRRSGPVSEHSRRRVASRNSGRNDRAAQLPSRCGVSNPDGRRARRHDDRRNACSDWRTRPNTDTRRDHTRLGWRTFQVLTAGDWMACSARRPRRRRRHERHDHRSI